MAGQAALISFFLGSFGSWYFHLSIFHANWSISSSSARGSVLLTLQSSPISFSPKRPPTLQVAKSEALLPALRSQLTTPSKPAPQHQFCFYLTGFSPPLSSAPTPQCQLPRAFPPCPCGEGSCWGLLTRCCLSPAPFRARSHR